MYKKVRIEILIDGIEFHHQSKQQMKKIKNLNKIKIMKVKKVFNS